MSWAQWRHAFTSIAHNLLHNELKYLNKYPLIPITNEEYWQIHRHTVHLIIIIFTYKTKYGKWQSSTYLSRHENTYTRRNGWSGRVREFDFDRKWQHRLGHRPSSRQTRTCNFVQHRNTEWWQKLFVVQTRAWKLHLNEELASWQIKQNNAKKLFG